MYPRISAAPTLEHNFIIYFSPAQLLRCYEYSFKSFLFISGNLYAPNRLNQPSQHI